MKNFGFQISKDRQIDFDKHDHRLLMFVLGGEPSFNCCISCGGCTATCSAGNLIDFNIRKLNVLIRRGETDDLEREINKCMLCGKCILVCPRGINTRNVILKIKEAIVKFKKV